MSDPVTQTPLPAPATSSPAAKPRRRRWPKVLLGVFALLLLSLYFAPAIVAKTALRNRLTRAAAADLNGTLDIGSASLGWFSPIEFRDVTLTDSLGRVVARIPKLSSSRTLADHLWNRTAGYEITLDHPTVEIVCERETTNLEDVLRKILDDDTPPGPARTPLVVKVTDGTLTLRNSETSGIGEFHNVEAIVTVPAALAEPILAKVSADAPGRIEAEVSAGEASRVKLTAAGFALESLAPVLRRLEPGLTLNGSLTADITATWGKDAAGVDGTIGVKNLVLTASKLNGDTLHLASAELPVKLAITGRTIRIDRADLTTDIGSVSLAGTFDPTEPLDRFLERPGTKFGATVELAKLAAVLPRLLRVRDGTEFRDGKLVVKLDSRVTPDGAAWTGNVTTSALRATRAEKEIRWDEPLSVEFAGSVKAGQFPIIDKLVCKSDFMAVNAEIKPDTVRAAANVYLDRLAARLTDFVDLDGVALDGRGSAWIVATRTPDGHFKADGAAELKQFALTDRSGRGLREPDVKLQLTATGSATDSRTLSLATGTVTLSVGPDECRLKLLEPISDAKQLATAKYEATLTGDLARWKKRAVGVVPALNDYTIVGSATATVRFNLAGDVATFASTLDATDFAIGPAMDPDWSEKKLRLEVGGSFTQSSGTLALTAAKVVRPGLELSATGSISKFDTTTDANLTGTLTYDMATLTPKLRELLGGNFTATGKGSKPLALVGSLTPPAKPGMSEPPNLLATLNAELGFGWESLHAYGFDVGEGELRTKLANGVSRVTPAIATFGGGKVTLRPTLRFAPTPGAVTFAKGPLVEKAKLTPAACASALGFVLPAIANSTKAEGEISVALEESRIPFDDTSKASAKGTITIHHATVTAGPVIGEVAKLLGANNATMTLANEQTVPVRVENGRVYHENLTVKVGGYFVKTTGSVGFDSTLDLVVDVPIPGGLPGLKLTPVIAKALSGKRVQVPLRGTLAAPKLDAKAFETAVAKLAHDAVKDVGKGLLNKELDKLFPGMPKK